MIDHLQPQQWRMIGIHARATDSCRHTLQTEDTAAVSHSRPSPCSTYSL